jgi:hypothetical protein
MAASVRSLTVAEGRHLQRVMRRGKDRTAILRAQVVLMSDQGFRAKQISEVTRLHEEYVRELIRLFNVDGLEILKRKPGSGRHPMFSEEMQTIIVEFALSPPQVFGQPFTAVPDRTQGAPIHRASDIGADPGGQKGPPPTHQDLEGVERPRL